ncbi:MAG: MCE family protein [Bacteroidetes bacterium]|nr:MAG: MCE family protein [Bacteroidota bacterium]
MHLDWIRWKLFAPKAKQLSPQKLSLQHMKISNESKVGIFTAIALTILILGYNFLKGRDLFTRTNTYYAEFSKVDGLVPSNPVLISGYRIGQVTSVDPVVYGDSIRFRVSIEVQKSMEIPVNSTIKIYSADLFGSKAIEMLRGNSTEVAVNHAQLEGFMEPGLVENLSKITLPLREKVESILSGLDSTMNGPEGEALKESMRQLPITMARMNGTLASLESTMNGRVQEIMTNANKIVKNLADNGENIDMAIANFRSFSDTLSALELQAVVTNATSALAQLNTTLTNINDGNGSLGKLATDEALYTNLKDASASLDALLKDMKEHPKRYVSFSVFGKKDKK